MDKRTTCLLNTVFSQTMDDSTSPRAYSLSPAHELGDLPQYGYQIHIFDPRQNASGDIVLEVGVHRDVTTVSITAGGVKSTASRKNLLAARLQNAWDADFGRGRLSP
jgi:hypothetical protein